MMYGGINMGFRMDASEGFEKGSKLHTPPRRHEYP
jgi:hypothetical protein